MVQVQSPYARPRADILLITVTKVESRAVLDLFPNYERRFIGAKTYYNLGIVGEAKVFMVQSEMGSQGPGGSMLTIWEGLQALSPSAVIMVGIAFGVKPDEQAIGDVLVSMQIRDYDLQRVSTDPMQRPEIQLRGDRTSSSIRLLDKFRGGANDWNAPPNVHFGLILSGNKLIDNKDYRDQLVQLEPEAIGGEMEGAVLYAVAQRRKIDWILVKAICDWADGNKAHNKQQYQQEAARNAARFTLHVIEQGGLSRDTSEGAASPMLGSLLCSYNAHAQWVLALTWEPRGNRIASTGGDGTVRVWDTDTKEHITTYRGHQPDKGLLARTSWLPKLYSVAWSPVESRIASAGDGKTVHIWDANTGGTVCVYQGHSGIWPSVYALDWSPDGTRIASACSSPSLDKTIHIWDMRTGQTIRRCDTHSGLTPNFSVLSLAWSPNGRYIAATGGDQTIRLWNTLTGEHIKSYHVSSPWTSHLAWSPNSQFLANANSDTTCQIWDTSIHQLVLTYGGHRDGVRAVAWSPDGTTIASASNDTTVQLWDASTGSHIFTYEGHKNWATSVAWSPDGTRVASGSNDKTVQVWQAT